jgi:deazaflavin-dependent oxidoreductase (nitroreductase family)
VPSDRFLKLMNGTHRAVLRLSGGRLGWNASGMTVLELTTTGRKSGQPRPTMLTSPLRVDSAYIVVASRGGDDTHPAWFLNLQADPSVLVGLKGTTRPMHARVATAAERAALWPRITADHPNYAGYQRRTSREIPLVFLEP